MHHLCEVWSLESPNRIVMKNEIETFNRNIDLYPTEDEGEIFDESENGDRYNGNTNNDHQQNDNRPENQQSQNLNFGSNNKFRDGQYQQNRNQNKGFGQSSSSSSSKNNDANQLPPELMSRLNEIKKCDLKNLNNFNTNQNFNNNNSNNTNQHFNNNNYSNVSSQRVGLLSTPNFGFNLSNENIIQPFQQFQAHQIQQQLIAHTFLNQGILNPLVNPLAQFQTQLQLMPIMQLQNNNFGNNTNKGQKRKHSGF